MPTNQTQLMQINKSEIMPIKTDMYKSFPVCPSELGGSMVPKEYCTRPVDESTPLSLLLPSCSGVGLCSYAMLDLLFRKQNDFLDKYLREAKR